MTRSTHHRARLTPLLRFVAAFVSVMLMVGNVVATAHLASAAHRLGLEHRDTAHDAAHPQPEYAETTDQIAVGSDNATGPLHTDGQCVASVLSQQHAPGLASPALLQPYVAANAAAVNVAREEALRPTGALFRLAPKLSPPV